MRCGDVIMSTIVAMTLCCVKRKHCHYVRFTHTMASQRNEHRNDVIVTVSIEHEFAQWYR